MIHRALLARLFTLRESAGALFRRFGGIYRAGCFGFHQDFAASRGQRILLATCLISFVQDSISEDEMMMFSPEPLRHLMSRSTMNFRNLLKSLNRRRRGTVLKWRNNRLSVHTVVSRVLSPSTSAISGSSCERDSMSFLEISLILKRTSLCLPAMVQRHHSHQRRRLVGWCSWTSPAVFLPTALGLWTLRGSA